MIREAHWPSNLSGNLLLADLDLWDPNFAKTVVLVINHDDRGAFGLILNQPGAPWPGDPVMAPEITFQGGPVQVGGLCILGKDLPKEYLTEGAIPVIHRICFASHVPEHLWTLEPGKIDSTVRIFSGYSGWGPGQLEQELKWGAWATIPATPDLVFFPNPEELWIQAMRIRGGLYQVFAETGFKPSRN